MIFQSTIKGLKQTLTMNHNGIDPATLKAMTRELVAGLRDELKVSSIKAKVQAKYRVGKLKIIIDYSTPDDVSRANLESIGNN